MEKPVKLLPPHMPNFIRFNVPLSERANDQFREAKDCIPVESLSKKEAEEYGELMKQEFIKHWNKKQTHKR